MSGLHERRENCRMDIGIGIFAVIIKVQRAEHFSILGSVWLLFAHRILGVVRLPQRNLKAYVIWGNPLNSTYKSYLLS